MKNTSIFIPLLLIGCLAALIYLFFAALSAAEDNGGDGPDKITLNPEDYQDPADAPDTLDLRGKENGNFEEYFEEVPQDEKVVSNAETEVNDDDDRTPSSTGIATPPATSTVTLPPPAATTTGNGRYLVIAGTFRQAAGADERVAALRAAGFNDARLERFNRGTFAVALAGQSDRYSTAKKMADEIAGKGFEVRVMKRR